MEECDRAAQTVVQNWKQKIHFRITDLDVDGKMSL
jgi:hypothetical protein